MELTFDPFAYKRLEIDTNLNSNVKVECKQINLIVRGG